MGYETVQWVLVWMSVGAMLMLIVDHWRVFADDWRRIQKIRDIPPTDLSTFGRILQRILGGSR